MSTFSLTISFHSPLSLERSILRLMRPLCRWANQDDLIPSKGSEDQSVFKHAFSQNYEILFLKVVTMTVFYCSLWCGYYKMWDFYWHHSLRLNVLNYHVISFPVSARHGSSWLYCKWITSAQALTAGFHVCPKIKRILNYENEYLPILLI